MSGRRSPFNSASDKLHAPSGVTQSHGPEEGKESSSSSKDESSHFISSSPIEALSPDTTHPKPDSAALRLRSNDSGRTGGLESLIDTVQSTETCGQSGFSNGNERSESHAGGTVESDFAREGSTSSLVPSNDNGSNSIIDAHVSPPSGNRLLAAGPCSRTSPTISARAVTTKALFSTDSQLSRSIDQAREIPNSVALPVNSVKARVALLERKNQAQV